MKLFNKPILASAATITTGAIVYGLASNCKDAALDDIPQALCVTAGLLTVTMFMAAQIALAKYVIFGKDPLPDNMAFNLKASFAIASITAIVVPFLGTRIAECAMDSAVSSLAPN